MSTSPERSAFLDLARTGFGTIVVLAATSGALVGLWVAAENGFRTTSLDFWGSVALISATYFLASMPFALLIGAFAGFVLPARLERTATRRALVSLLFSAFVAVWTTTLVRIQLKHLVPGVGPAILIVSVVAACSGLAARQALKRIRATTLAFLLLVVTGGAILGFTREAALPGAQVSPEARFVDPARPTRRLLLVGFDGLDPHVLDFLIRRGDLPTFKRLREQGTWGAIATMRPTLSPVIWTTIATGVAPQRHGIWDFFSVQLRGVEQPIRRWPRGTGVIRAFDLLQRVGLARRMQATSTSRRTKALWNILSLSGKRSAVVNWWASWPAESVAGIVVTNRLHEAPSDTDRHLVHPDAMTSPLRRLMLAPEDGSDPDPSCVGSQGEPRPSSLAFQEGFLKNRMTADKGYLRIAEQFLSTRDFDLVAGYFRGVDIASHLMGPYSALQSQLHPSVRRPTRPRVEAYEDTLACSYRGADRALERLLSAAGSDVNVVVCSDHGFAWRSGVFGHAEAPPAVLILAGPDLRRGAVLQAARIDDVAPTVLHLLGMPVARDMSGRVLTEALESRSGSAHAVEFVASYGLSTSGDMAESLALDPETAEGLRALGYIK